MNLNLDLLDDDAVLKLTVGKLKQALLDAQNAGCKLALTECDAAILPPDDLRPKGVLLIQYGDFRRRMPLDHAVSLRHLSFEAQERLFAVFDKQSEPDAEVEEEPLSFGIPEKLEGVESLLDKRIEMSVRLRNCLSNDSYSWNSGDLRQQVSNLMRKTRSELMRIPNFGRASYHELVEILWDNFSLRHHPNGKY